MSTSIVPASDVQRLACRVFTFAGWITGSLLFTPSALLLEFLNRGDPVLRFADVHLPGQRERHAIFVVERTAILAIIPDTPALENERTVISSRASIERRVSWLLPGGGVIEGGLEMLEGVRMDEYLAHRTKFVGLRDCTLYLPDGAGGTGVEPDVPFVALQTNRTVGATEVPRG